MKEFIVKIIHQQELSKEMDETSSGKILASKQLLHLRPFIDDDGLLRVGCRLRQAEIPYHQK